MKKYIVTFLVLIVATLALGGYPSWTEILVNLIRPQGTSAVTVKNNAQATSAFVVQNSRGTILFKVDSTGTVTTPIFATIVDSFTTTGATDSVALTSGLGFTTSSKVFVSQWNPAWSTAVDTAIYSGQVVVTGAGNTRLVITRVKSYTGNGATAVKSAAQYIARVEP